MMNNEAIPNPPLGHNPFFLLTEFSLYARFRLYGAQNPRKAASVL